MSEHLPQRALVIMAHPDDPEFFCGGTVARWVRAGCDVTYVVITRGDKGSDVPDMTPERLMILRMAEQRTAAAFLGVKEVVFLDYHDGELVPDMRLREDLVQQIRLHRPDTVILQDPTTYYIGDSRINHPCLLYTSGRAQEFKRMFTGRVVINAVARAGYAAQRDIQFRRVQGASRGRRA